MGSLKGFGDIATKGQDILETYYDQWRQGVWLPKRRWVKKADFVPPVIPGAEPLQKFLDEHALPELWTFFADYKKLLECGTYHVKAPDWMEPPLTAIAQPIRNDTGVAVTTTTPVEVLKYVVPDRCFASLKGFGQGLCPFEGWDNTLWTIQINKAPIKGYSDFRNQIGTFRNPSALPVPKMLGPKMVLQVMARLAVAGDPVTAYAHLGIHEWASKDLSKDGTYREQHVAN